MDPFDGLLREALVLCASLALPILAAATLVGVVVAIAQAATQVQEQTLTLLPKILTVGLMIAVFGRLALDLLARLFMHAVEHVPELVRAAST